MAKRISIVIPTLNAAGYLPRLFEAFEEQTLADDMELVVVDSDSDDDTVALVESRPYARVTRIARNAFTHGYARNLGVREARGDIVVFVTQDARPANPRWLAELVAPFEDPGTGAVFSRQLPYPDANPIERTFINFWFPETPSVRRGRTDPGQDFRFLDVFFSNVSSAVRRGLALRHPFLEDIIMSEDQQFARDILSEGHNIVYTPRSETWHSHSYSLKQVFQRYFDSAYSLTCIFGHTMGETVQAGRGYLPHEAKTIITKHPLWIPYYVLYFLAKGLGVFAGHLAPHMPRKVARALSMHKRFWDNPTQHHHAGSPS